MKRTLLAYLAVALFGFGAAVLANGFGRGSAQSETPPRRGSYGQILSGENVGVQVAGPVKDGRVEGNLMVKINGQWVAVRNNPRLIPMTGR